MAYFKSVLHVVLRPMSFIRDSSAFASLTKVGLPYVVMHRAYAERA